MKANLLNYKSCLMNGESLEDNESQKEFEKNLKKVLDKFDKM